ncbi:MULTISPECIES: PKD domain-containing protein [unclassified Nocardioides]|uniref:PKD domain-containing protein n=1 Tax=unclassified Nocardioides TaxID=2615069 RepID=UPI0012E340CC|nr:MULTISPECIES: PKD domain-containing protein [unclassified Nocardioides]
MLLLIVAMAIASPANAGDEDPPPPPTTSQSATGTASSDSLLVDIVEHAEGKAQNSNGGANHSSDGKPVFTAGGQACAGAEQVVTVDGNLLAFSFCPPASGPEVLTISEVRNAFARLKLPAAKLVIQPPDGLTLVNFDTNFYTTSTRPISRTVTLLGQRVTLEATPAEFEWTFGDGESLATTEPGAPYPALRITHNYLQTGTYQPSLDTVFTGRYRVGGGPWQQIPGTVTIEGTGQDLRAIEAEPKLVGY